MGQRTFTLTATVVDATNTAVPNAPCSVQILTPTGAPAVDGNGSIVESAPVNCTTNASGQLVAMDGVSAVLVDYPGDYQSAYVNSQVQVILNGLVIQSPVGFSYASSIAASSWIGTPSTAGLVTMRVVYTQDNNAGVSDVPMAVSLSQAAVVVASGQVAAGSSFPVQALTGADGTALFSLNPNSLLNPSNLTYQLVIQGEPQPFIFTVPAVVDVYKGAYNNATTYHGASGSSNGDVVLSGGVLYRCIATSTNNAPPSATYWQVVSGLPTDLITAHLTGQQQVGTIALTQTGIAADPSYATGTFANPPVTLQDELRAIAQATLSVRRVTTNTTVAITDDIVEVDASGGNVTIILPTAVGFGKQVTVKRVDGSNNTVTLITTGAQTIDGAAAVTYPRQYEALTVYSNGTNWEVRAGYLETAGGGGGASFSYVLKAANYTITPPGDSGIEVDASAGPITITLPSAAGVTQLFAVKKIDSSANAVTIATAGTQTIDGLTNRTLTVQQQEYVIGSDGANWRVYGSYLPNPLQGRGDIVVGNTVGFPTRFPPGADGTVLVYDSTQTLGVRAGTVGGAVTWATKTANYTVTTTDTGILVDATSGNITITLPTAVNAAQQYAIRKKDTSANWVAVVCTGTQTINGLASRVLWFAGQSIVVASDNANWSVVATAGIVPELLVQDGVSAPPVALETEARTDFLYMDV